jgi:hypothetical protein
MVVIERLISPPSQIPPNHSKCLEEARLVVSFFAASAIQCTVADYSRWRPLN